MVVFATLSAISLVASLLLTPLFRAAASLLKVVDVPDSVRKIHRHSIPRIGGVAVFLAYYGSFLVMAAVSHRTGIGVLSGFGVPSALLPGVAVVFFIGLLDDVIGLKPWQKLLGQVLAGVLVVTAGIHVRYLPGSVIQPWLAAAGTIVWLTLCSNAMNLIDGLDGLATGIALLASSFMFVASLLNGHVALAVAIAPLIGALVGFLVFNFVPASIFLGDSGSLVIGFLLGCYGVLWSENTVNKVGLTAPLIALAVPLLDTGIAILRRFLRRRPIFSADLSHIHHRLLARGFTPLRTVLCLYAAGGIAGALSLLVNEIHHPWPEILIVVLVSGVAFSISKLGYVEFAASRRLLLGGTFRRILNEQLALQYLEAELSEAVTPQDCWEVVFRSASRDFGFHRITMHLAGRCFQQHDGVRTSGSWAIHIPISEQDWVEVSREFCRKDTSSSVVDFIETVRKVLAQRSPVSVDAPEKPYRAVIVRTENGSWVSAGSEVDEQPQPVRPL